MKSAFLARWLASSEVISQVLFTSKQPNKNKNGFPFQIKLLFGPLVTQLVWYILKQLFTSVLVKVVDIYLTTLWLSKYPPLFTSTSVNNCLLLSSLRSRREWVPARTSVPNTSAKSRSGREKNGEESSWIPACSKTMLFWIVSSPANYYFHWLRAVTRQSNVNRYLSQGRTSVRRDATLRYCHDINQNGEHRFAICEDVCVSHLHSTLHFSHRVQTL